MGGYAEDALLAGAVTRPHDQEELRRAQLAELGFTDWETWGEAAPGVPFYLFARPLSDRHRAIMAQLRERFFADRTEEELLPPSVPLPS